MHAHNVMGLVDVYPNIITIGLRSYHDSMMMTVKVSQIVTIIAIVQYKC